MNRKILIVDDEETNLEIIEGFLKLSENADHNTIKCQNGKIALEKLMQNADDVDVILLDRMMPFMSGIEFLKEVIKDEKLKKIPVIMQTALGEKEHQIEGFQLGVYHYLVKPYSPIILNSIVRAAIETYSKYRELTHEVSHSKTLFKYIDTATFKIKTVEDCDTLSVSLAKLYPHPDKVVFGIAEMLTNAVEHGNLAITYEEKTQLNLGL